MGLKKESTVRVGGVANVEDDDGKKLKAKWSDERNVDGSS
jgi:hypothetical protein